MYLVYDHFVLYILKLILLNLCRLAYLRFVQTNAYYIIDPVNIQQNERSRSPFQELPAKVDHPPPTMFRPDSIRDPAHHNRHQKLLPKFRTMVTGPKGIDLLQLGLGLSQDNPVFKQAYQLLMKRQRAALEFGFEPSPATNNERGRDMPRPKIKANLKSIRKWNYYWIWWLVYFIYLFLFLA